jgi:branched-chain amino acid transport system permease protein
MRNIFKTSYIQDIRLFEHGGHVFWYGLLLVAVLAAPWLLPRFYIGDLAFVFIYAIAGIGLMLLTGFTGLASLGHAAFLGIGAYAHNFLVSKLGVPFVASLALAGFIAAAFGIAFALPALRMTGIYLAIATLAFSVIMEQVFSHWDVVTGGFRGMAVKKPNLFGWSLASDTQFYYLCFAVLVLVALGARNVLRSPTGRAMIAIRDSEVSAQSMGINIARTKVVAFGLSTFITGVAGGLFAHKIEFLAPDAFGIILSIQLLLMIVVGGLGSLHGAVYGAVVIVLLPQFLSLVKDVLPPKIGQTPGLEPGVFGLILILFILLEPLGIYGRWRKVRLYFELFPMYRRATFKRQRGYIKTERMR